MELKVVRSLICGILHGAEFRHPFEKKVAGFGSPRMAMQEYNRRIQLLRLSRPQAEH
jgi:hypothetical protein